MRPVRRARSGSRVGRPGRVFLRPTADQPTATPKPGQERCPSCGKPVAVTYSGFLRRHRDLSGFPCGNVRREVAG